MQLAAAELRPLTDLYDSNGRPFSVAAATWTMVDEGPVSVATSSGPGCLNAVPQYTAAYGREFSYGLAANGFERGHGGVIVYAGQSAIEIARAQQEVATSDYQACYATAWVRVSLTDHPGLTLTGATARQLQAINVGVPNVTVLFTTPYRYQNTAKLDYTVVSWIAFDRYRAISYVETCCGQPSMIDIQPDVLLLAQRMQAVAQR